jgi:hypothetical protein
MSNSAKEVVAENLADVRVNNDMVLDFQSMMGLVATDEILPETGGLRDKLNRYIGELPLFTFIFETLTRDLYENGTYNAERKGVPLNEFPDFGDLQAVANHLVNDFESLPWSYQMSFELPSSIGKQIRDAVANYELSENFRIVSPDETYDTNYPLRSGIKNRDQTLFGGGLLQILQSSEQWNKETACIQIDLEGFVGHYGKQAPIQDGLSTLKAFMGLSLAVRLLKAGTKPATSLLGMPPKSQLVLVLHRKTDDHWQIWSTYDLPSDLSETLAGFEIDDLEGRVDANKLSSWIRSRLPIISIAFQNPGKAEHVLLAAQWLLDSYVGKNELLSFVQSTVAMEILLGEEAKSDVIGIGELLRNRCAYLIGKSRSAREGILGDFDKIYTVRSKIVHRGKSRLNSEERILFQKLQWMCRRVISEELNLIAKDKESAT